MSTQAENNQQLTTTRKEQGLAAKEQYAGGVLQKGDVENEEHWDALAEAEASNISMIPNYWSPEAEGEMINAFYLGLRKECYPSMNEEGADEMVDTAMFATLIEGNKTVLSNASRRLVSAVREFKPGTMIQVIYKGQRKNKTNAFKSAVWDVKPLKTTN